MTGVDWPTLLGELALLLGEPDVNGIRAPVTERKLAEHLDIPRMTIHGWINGSEPKHADGEQLIERWCKLTSKDRLFVPQQRRVFSAARVR